MNFKDVAIKNFRKHIRNYLSYFLCSSFSVMIFFMYSTIFLNDKLKTNEKVSKGVVEVLSVPCAALLIFSVIFVSYAHSSFIKSRHSEFGLFLSLGMSIKQIIRMIIIENGLVGIASILTGIVSGAVFSRLFFIIVLRVLQLSDIGFSLPVNSFLLTLVIFMVIFFLAIIASIVTAYRFQPVQLLKSNRVSQGNKISNPALALVGIAMITVSIILLCIKFASSNGMDSSFLLIATAVCLIGLYISISQIGGLILDISKRRKSFYYKNLRLITGLDHRFRQTKKIIFTTTIMVMVTTFYCGALFYFSASAEKSAKENNPFHVAYLQLADKNNIPDSQLNEILKAGGAKLEEHKILEALNLEWISNNTIIGRRKVISVEKLNEITGSKIKIETGCYALLNQIPNSSDPEGKSFGKEEVLLKSGNVVRNFKFQQEINKIYFNRLETFWTDILLIDNIDFEMLKRESAATITSVEKIHLLNFKDWVKTNLVVKNLDKTFMSYNKNSPIYGFASERGYEEQEFFKVLSRVEEYTYEKQSSSMILFASGFLGLFFFVAASIILSFRLFSEIDDDKAKYKQLSNIGIRDIEVKRTINQELGLIFFLPVILGAILSLLYIYAFTRDGGRNNAPMVYNISVSLVYLMFQIVFYFIVRKIYSDKIVESLIVES